METIEVYHCGIGFLGWLVVFLVLGLITSAISKNKKKNNDANIKDEASKK